MKGRAAWGERRAEMVSAGQGLMSPRRATLPKQRRAAEDDPRAAHLPGRECEDRASLQLRQAWEVGIQTD